MLAIECYYVRDHNEATKKSEIYHVTADSGKSLYLTLWFPLSLNSCFPYKYQPIPELKQAPFTLYNPIDAFAYKRLA